MLRHSSRRPATSCLRRLSGYAGRGGRGGRGIGSGGGRGGHGRHGGRGQQGRGSGAYEGKFIRGGPPKENFAHKYLDPAARGELIGKHDAGIPKLAARKGKGHQLHEQFSGAEIDEDFEPRFLDDPTSGLSESTSMWPGREDSEATSDDGLGNALQILYPGFIDDEDEYDEIDTGGFDPENHPQVYKDGAGKTVLRYDPLHPHFVAGGEHDADGILLGDGIDGADNDNGNDIDDIGLAHDSGLVDDSGLADYDVDDADIVDDSDNASSGRQKFEKNEFIDPEELFFDRDNFDFEVETPELNVPRSIANSVLPLMVKGDGFDDFLEASYNHPSKYADVRRYNHHPESLREAKPFFPKNRLQPPLEFVMMHQRFIFVSGLPHYVEPDGTLGELENPIHRLEVSEMVSELLEMPVASIFPASMTSAFVGYADKAQFYEFLMEGPTCNKLERILRMSIYSPEEGEANPFAAGDAVIKIEDVPADMTMPRFAHVLFPADTELGTVFGPISVDDLKQVGTTTVLVRLKSAEQAIAAVSSPLVHDHLEALGGRVVQFFRARRQLVFGGYTGPNKGQTFKKRGNKLAVDGDAPSKEFLQSHAAVVQLRNVDEGFTKEDISKYVEPFSGDRRDVIGSIEFPLCLAGDRTHIAYVGFDRPGEAEAFIKSCSGLVNLGKGPVTVRLVKEQWSPKADLPRETRPARSGEDVLESLDKWENFVDMKQVEALEALGVNREILADAFRTMRFNNLSYGAMDWGMAREKLDPTKPDSGQQMRETMQLYIDTLMEIASSDDLLPGMSLAEIMSLPDDEREEGDVGGDGILEDDKKRVMMIAQQRSSYFFEK